MTKKEIVRQLCDKANKEKLLKGSLTQLATKVIVQWTFDAIIETLVKEGRIELRNFGVFEVKQRKPRKARNPRTGARVDVEAKNVVTFQPGKEMEERVRKFAKPIEPLGLAIAPNGDILTTNGGDGNLVETTPDGQQVAVKMLDTSPAPPGPNGNGTLFGLAVVPDGSGVYFVDDGTNTLDLLH